MKILLLGDASNYHRCLGDGLAALGHDVTVASAGSGWMDTDRNIDISRPLGGKLGGALLWAKLLAMQSRFKGYDIVQLSSPGFIEQRPNRIEKFFDLIRKHNGSVFLTALGTDHYFHKMCVDPNGPLKYNEWMINGKLTNHYHSHQSIATEWSGKLLEELARKIYSEVDGVVTALYEYDLSVKTVLPPDKVAYAGIPINTKSIKPVKMGETPQKVKFFLGRHKSRMSEKGTDIFERVARQLIDKHPSHCELEIVENLPYNKYIQQLRNAHVVLDQLYSYTPATNALLAMAMGLNTVSGGEPEFYDFIGEPSMRPVINGTPDNDKLFSTLEEIALHPEQIIPRGIEGREFVVKHNDYIIVAQRFVDFWEKRLNTK